MSFSSIFDRLALGRPVARRKRRRRPARFFVEKLEQRALLTTYTVNSTSPGTGGLGVMTLFNAIAQVDADTTDTTTPDTINFAIPTSDSGYNSTTGVWTIDVLAFPAITRPVIIDGASQTGYAGKPLIDIDGSQAASRQYYNGLIFQVGGNTIKGLDVTNFQGFGIVLDGTNDSSHGTGPGLNNIVQSCFIGTDPTGENPAPNWAGGIDLVHSSYNLIGGKNQQGQLVEGNLISANGQSNIYLGDQNDTNNYIEGNYIGTDAVGLNSLISGLPGVNASLDGVAVVPPLNAPDSGFAFNNFIGNLDPRTGKFEPFGFNVISGNARNGVYIVGGSANLVAGNDIGVGPDGATPVPNGGDGVRLEDASENIVGVPNGGPNIISGNLRNGVEIITDEASQDGTPIHLADKSAVHNLLQGNFIGTNADGTASVPNGGANASTSDLIGNGVLLVNNDTNASVTVSDNQIGLDPAKPDVQGTNVISGNAGDGVLLLGPNVTGNTVAGNIIGLDKGDKKALPNQIDGVGIANTAGQAGPTANSIGTNDTLGSNVISGNLHDGVSIDTSNSNSVSNNFIGTDGTGLKPLPNLEGVSILNSSDTTVGGNADLAGNVISGNSDNGVVITGGTNNSITNNLIGVGKDGYTAVPNKLGVSLLDTTADYVGAASAGNVIAANTSDGISIAADASGNFVLDNTIGTSKDGLFSLLGNGGDGIRIEGPSNIIGGATADWTNVLADNKQNGIRITGAAAKSNSIQGNDIGIDRNGQQHGNQNAGVAIADASQNTIGGGPLWNVISNNAQVQVAVDGQQAHSNEVGGNYIGTNAGGTAPEPGNGSASNGAGSGVEISLGAALNQVGFVDGSGVVWRNVISANSTGISLSYAGSGNVVKYNDIGTNADGTAALTPLGDLSTQHVGILIDNTPGTVIGADSFSAGGNVISGNSGDGIYVDGSQSVGNQITANCIGGGTPGDNSLGNDIPNGRNGITLDSLAISPSGNGPSTNTTVSGNEIAFNQGSGITLGNGTNGNHVVGNSLVFNNGYGINVQDSPKNFIGEANAGNKIENTTALPGADPSAVTGIGIRITGPNSSYNRIQSNDLENNDGWGILVNGGAFWNTIGGAGLGNSVIGSGGSHIEISGQGTGENTVVGNLLGIGPDGKPGTIHGTGNLGFVEGIYVGDGADGNVIGGSSAELGNTIAASEYGILLNKVSNTFVEGNQIGTNASGEYQPDYANEWAGIDVVGGSNNRIGGDAPSPGAAPGNKLLGDGVGVVLAGSTNGAWVQGNEIAHSQGYHTLGADIDGVSDANGVGMLLVGNVSDNLIGGYGGAEANSIHDNAAEGVDVHSGSGNSILRNKIFNNVGQGILNEQLGPSQQGAAPFLAEATTGGSHRLAGSYQGQPNTKYTLEVFAGAKQQNPDGSLNDDAETLLLGDQQITTNAGGMALFDLALPTNTSAGAVLIATATDNNGGTTSSFSNQIVVGNDTDGDGIPDSEEDHASPGAADSASVASLSDVVVPGQSITLQGPAGSSIKNAESLVNPSPDDAPAGEQFTLGFTSFELEYSTGTPPQPDQHIVVTESLPQSAPAGADYWRYGPTADLTSPHWYRWDYNPATGIGAQIVGNQVFLNFIDGALGDDDLSDNGVIADAGGVGFPDPFTVVNTNDSGPGSLRQAILHANADSSQYQITFNLPGPAPHTIHLLSPLPAITSENLTIDGFQLAPSTNATPTDGTTPQIELDGSQAGPGADGLTLQTDGLSLQGIVIDRFSGDGIQIESTDPQNFYGETITGMTIEHNGGYGIEVDDTPYNSIGRPGNLSANVLSANGLGGVDIRGADASYNSVQGNLIGVAADGATPLGNQGPGVVVDGGATLNTIGGSGAGNTIAYNTGPGVEILNATTTVIEANSIFANTGLGIDLGGDGVTPNDPGDADTGPNDLQNFPIVTRAASHGGQTFISGTLSSLPNTTFTIDLFTSPSADPTGYGQGQKLLDEVTATTDGAGQASFDATLNQSIPGGWYVTATATSSVPGGGNTSEFSQAVPVDVMPPGPRVYVVNTADDVDAVPPDPTHFSLREAIEAANSNPGLDTISFDLPDQTRTIFPLTPLPDITDPVIIDGTTQFGYAGLPLVELDGSKAGPGADGLRITGGGSVVRGLVIHSFQFDSSTGVGGNGIELAGGGGNVIEGNFLGTDVTGTNIEADQHADVYVNGSPDNLIGGTTAAARNLVPYIDINGYDANTGQLYANSGGNRVEGNYITTDVTGTVALSSQPWMVGVQIGNSSGNTVGGTEPGAGNLIAGGVHIFDAYNNVVQGNLLNTDITGAKRIGTSIGVEISGPASGNLIGGATASARNIIATGLVLDSDSNQVEGNYIGTDVTGTVALNDISGYALARSAGATGVGLYVEGAYNTIGGADPGEGNLISGDSTGISLAPSAHGNTIAGNRIGTDASGTKALSNGWDSGNDYGIWSQGYDNTIGGVTAGAGNLISGNSFGGIRLSGSGSDSVQGNLIGTDITGAAAIGNGAYTGYGAGVLVEENNAVIGYSLPGGGNVISGNQGDGIAIDASGGASHVFVLGNKIGTDATGTLPLGNAGDGIYSVSINDDVIGLAAPDGGNVISANGGDGIDIAAGGGATIQGNKVGVDITGTQPLGNAGDGVSIISSYGLPSNNVVGGAVPGAGNVVAYNGARGVNVPFGQGNQIERNEIFANAGPGLVTDINDTLSSYAALRGVSVARTAPVLVSAVTDSTGTTLTGSLTGTPFTSDDIDLFANSAPDPSGFGQGQTYLQSVSVFIDQTGAAQFQLPLNATLPVGTWITATATPTSGPGNTSSFSRALPVVAAVDASDVQLASPSYLVTENGGSAVITVTRTGSTAGTATVDYATSDGSAAAGVDYTATSGTMTFDDGEATQTATIPIADDGASDGDKTFQLTLSNVSGASLGAVHSAMIMIANDAPAGQIVFATAASSFNDSFDTNGSYSLELTRTGGSQGKVTVEYRVTGGTAVGSATGPINGQPLSNADYVDAFGTVTFDDGQTTAQIDVAPYNPLHTDHRGPRTIEVTIGNPTGGATLGALTTSTLTIDDPQNLHGAFALFTSDTSVSESGKYVRFSITRFGPLDYATISYTTVDGSAKAGDNYVATSGTATFVAGQQSGYIDVPILDDHVVDVPGDFQFVLSNPSGGAIVLGDDHADVAITDSDAPPPPDQYFVAQGGVDVVEGGVEYRTAAVYEDSGMAQIVVRRVNGVGQPDQGPDTAQISYATSDGTAKAGVDYTAESGTLTIPPYQDVAAFYVPILPDSDSTGEETFYVTLSNLAGDGVILGNAAPITIHERAGVVQFVAPQYVVAEAQASVTLTVSGPGPIDYTTEDGTAQAGVRYTATSGTLPEGTSTISIPLLNNTPVDGNQTFYVKLLNPLGGMTLGPNNVVPVTVLDEDRDSALPLVGTGGFTYSASEGAAPTDQAVATFTDPGAPGLPSDYSADIDWGDGTTTPADAITQDAQTQVFSVSGSHAYADEGTFDVRVILHHPGASDVVVRSKAVAIDPSVIGMGSFSYVATVGATPSIQTVAAFSDPAGAETLADYSAHIDWGDGTPPTTGIIGEDMASLFTVSGAHAYVTGGAFTIHVTLHHGAATDAQVTSDATVTSISSATTTTLTSDHASGATYGETVTLTAQVSAAGGTPPGSVDFVDQTTGQDLGAATLAVVNGIDEASVSATGLTAGSHNIFASYTSDTTSFENSQGSLTQLIDPAALTVTADDKTKVYGQASPLLTHTITGFVNNDTTSVVSGSPILSTAATTSSGVGNYPITLAQGTLIAANYTFAFVNGSLSVTPAALTITANDQTMTYGGTLPTLTMAYAGLANGDTPATFGISPNVAPAVTAPASKHVGTYSGVIVASGASDPDYTISYAAGTLTVTPAALTITANDQTMTYGGTLPTLTVTYTGLVNGDTPATFSTSPNVAPAVTAPATKHVGAYTGVIIASGASDPDYAISYVAGTLTVTPATLTVTADNKTKVYGSANPPLTDTITGFVNGDASSVVNGAASLTTAATSASGVGNYAIDAGLGTLNAADYTFAFVNGNLSITPAPLTVTADNKSKVYGQANPPLTDTITGFVNGDTASVISGAADLNTVATTASGVGSYTITAGPGTLSAANYTFSFVNGTLTVNPDTTTTSVGATVFGLSVTFTVTVTANAPGSGTPTGSVDFFDVVTNNDLGSVLLSSGAASFTATLPASAQNIAVADSGDANFIASSGAISVSPLASVYVLNPSVSDALTVSGNSAINLPGVVVDDSSSAAGFAANGNVKIAAGEIDVVGGVHATRHASFSPAPITGHALVPDPLAGLVAPSGGASLGAIDLEDNASLTISPGVYTRIAVSGHAQLTLQPGVYFIAGGGFSVSGNASVSGAGVMIYNAVGSHVDGDDDGNDSDDGRELGDEGGDLGDEGGSSIDFSGDGRINLTAPATGPYAGILIFQARDDTEGLRLASGVLSGMSGTIYAAAAQLGLTGNASLNVPVVVNTLTLSGNAVLGIATSQPDNDDDDDHGDEDGEAPATDGSERSSRVAANAAVLDSAGLTPNQIYALDAYRSAFGTAGTTDTVVAGASLAAWAARLDAGLSHASFATALLHSDEYYGSIVDGVYQKYLGRAADGGGLAFWVGQLRQGTTDEQLESAFAGAAEFYQHAGGTDAGWVNALYLDMLGRAADSKGLAYWTGQLAQGANRAAVAQAFAAGVERESQRVSDDYFSDLGRTADAAGLAYWVNAFEHGLRNEDLVAGLLASDEYYQGHSY